ncbi:MAG: hypothetical protein NTZ50_16645, partial [Chloroflexi bacterium]|nr:hypothetical protein [Chloroflexota bacterium]
LLLTWQRLSSIPAGVDFKDAVLGVGGDIFIVLGGLVVLSIFSEWIERRRVSRTANDEKALVHLLRPVSLRLANARAGQPAELIENFRTMSSELQTQMRAHHENLHNLTKVRQEEFDKLRIFSEGLSAQIGGMQKAAEGMNTASSSVQGAIEELRKHTERLTQNENTLAIQMRKMVDELTVVAEKHQTGAKSFELQTDALGRSVRVFDGAIQEIGRLVPPMLASADGISNMHTSFLDRMSEQMLTQQSLTVQIENAAKGITDAGPSITRFGTSVDEIRKETGRLADKIDQSNQGTSQMVSAMNAAAKTHEAAAQRFDGQTTSLGAATAMLESSLKVLEPTMRTFMASAEGVSNMHTHFLNKMADLSIEQKDFASEMSAAVQEMKGAAPAFEKIGLAVETMREQVRMLNTQLGQSSQDSAAALRTIGGLATVQSNAADVFMKTAGRQDDVLRTMSQSQQQLGLVVTRVESAMQQVERSQNDFRSTFQQIVEKEKGVFDSLKSTLDVVSQNGPTIVELGRQLVDTKDKMADFTKFINDLTGKLGILQDRYDEIARRAGRL